ncbi:uncharacterized protein HaLaN_13561, partial [Haematococcus lacustris]
MESPFKPDVLSGKVVQQLGGLDVLVNCAAGNFLATAEELTPNGFRT